MKEIIYFLPDDNLGVASIVRNLLKYRPKSNNHYKVIFTRQIERKAIHIEDRFNADEQVTFCYSKYENLYAVFKRLKKHIPSEDTIIVANDGLELRMVKALKLKNPLVYIIHGDFNYYYMLAVQNQGMIDRFIAYSQYTLQRLQEKLLLVNQSKIKLEYYPVPELKREQTKTKDIDLLFVGSFSERKGVQYLKEIYVKAAEHVKNIKFSIVGSGEHEAHLKDDFNDYESVNFLGQLNNKEVFEVMERSKVLIFPSLSEGLPNVVVEAMKAVCVPVCSDIKSGIPDLIDHGVNGYKVPIGDTFVFAAYIVQLLQDHGLRCQLANHAKNKAYGMFNPTKNALAYQQLITQTTVTEKYFPSYALGGVLNQPFIPNVFVKLIRTLEISNKL